MRDARTTALGIKIAESGNNYQYQQRVQVGDRTAYKVGAYGFMDGRFAQLAEAMGMAGANWRDPTAQDKIAQEALGRSYQELEDWKLSVVAFRFGMPIARSFKERSITSAPEMDAAGYSDIARYLRNVERNVPRTQQPITGSYNVPDAAGPPERTTEGVDRGVSPHRKRAEEIVRSHLVNLRNQQRRLGQTNQIEETPTQEVE